MAFTFDSATKFLSRNTDLFDYNLPYTWTARIKIAALTTLDTILCITDGTSNNRDVLMLDTTAGNTLALRVSIGGATTTVAGSTVLSTGTWYNVAVVRSSPISLTAYLNGVLEVTDARDITNRAACSDMRIGVEQAGGNAIAMDIAHIKAWAIDLSVGMLNSEQRSIRPVYGASIYGWWPTIKGSTRALDFSGKGRAWTENGTIADADGPGIAWNGATPTLLRTSAIIIPRFDLEGYRFRNDDGSETTATWRQAQDTADSIARATRFRLRTLVNASFDPAASNFRLEYRKPDSLDWRKVQ